MVYTVAKNRRNGWDMGSWTWKNPRIRESLQPRGNLDGNEMVSDIAPMPQDLVILKQKPSAFFGTNLAAYLTLLGADSVVMGGTTTSGCVRATVMDAFSLNYRVAVIEDGCFDRGDSEPCYQSM